MSLRCAGPRPNPDWQMLLALAAPAEQWWGVPGLWCGCSPVTLKSRVLWLQDPEIREMLHTSHFGGPASTYGAAKSKLHFGGSRRG
eukprot:5252807-Lingulodinium_polyedra.AAC.1